MTVYIEKPAQNLREELAAARSKRRYRQEVFWFAGDGSTTSFTLPKGWLPKFIHVDGALMREGSAEDYVVSFNGFTHTVTLSVAPSTVDIGIICEGII